MTHRITLLAVWLVLASCESKEPAAPRPAGGNPFATHALEAEERHFVEGTVEERVRAGHYLYLRIHQPSGQTAWLVSLAATTPDTGRVRALVLGRAAHFRSRRLAREFHPLLFAAVRAADP